MYWFRSLNWMAIYESLCAAYLYCIVECTQCRELHDLCTSVRTRHVKKELYEIHCTICRHRQVYNLYIINTNDSAIEPSSNYVTVEMYIANSINHVSQPEVWRRAQREHKTRQNLRNKYHIFGILFNCTWSCTSTTLAMTFLRFCFQS